MKIYYNNKEITQEEFNIIFGEKPNIQEKLLNETININTGCSICGKKEVLILNPIQDLPSKWEIIKNLSNSVIEVTKSFIDGTIEIRSEEETKSILKICGECPFLIENGIDSRCGKCGCYLKFKVRLNSWHCPESKW